jgi:hypothetical protein
MAVAMALSPDGTVTVRAAPSRSLIAASKLRVVGVPRRP